MEKPFHYAVEYIVFLLVLKVYQIIHDHINVLNDSLSLPKVLKGSMMKCIFIVISCG